MRQLTKKVAFAMQHHALCSAAVCALQCSVTKRWTEEAAAKYHRRGSGTIKSRIVPISAPGLAMGEAQGKPCRAEPPGKVTEYEMLAWDLQDCSSSAII